MPVSWKVQGVTAAARAARAGRAAGATQKAIGSSFFLTGFAPGSRLYQRGRRDTGTPEAAFRERGRAMNLSILPINVMLAHSDRWLNDLVLRAQLCAHPVGAALLAEVARVHERLAGQVERRRQLELALARLTELLARLDLVHDNMARAIHGVLEALIAAAQEPAAAELYARLRDLLFPEGLSIVTRSYMYEAGAIAALGARVTDHDLAQMAEIQIGAQTLADWYHAWVDAGQKLGRHAHEREALLASAGRGGSASAATDTRGARYEWINVVQTLIGALDLMKLGPEAREQLLCSLEASVARALRRRAPDELDDELDDQIPLPDDDIPGDTTGPGILDISSDDGAAEAGAGDPARTAFAGIQPDSGEKALGGPGREHGQQFPADTATVRAPNTAMAPALETPAVRRRPEPRRLAGRKTILPRPPWSRPDAG
jgi:hypothetical protein